MNAIVPPPIVPVVLDVEASGFGARSYPIEVGLALSDETAYCRLIKPEPGWTHWDPAAEHVHHIGRDSLERYGVPASKVAEELNQRLAGTVVYTDAWGNDYTWLAKLYDAAQRVPSFRLESMRSLLSEAEAGRWHETKNKVMNELRCERHRASADARVLQLTLMRVKYGDDLGIGPRAAHQVDEMAALDMLTLAEFYRAAHGHCERTWLRARHANTVAAGGRVIAEHLEHQLAGYVLMRPLSNSEWEMAAFNLHPWYRRTGLYRRLLVRSVAHLISHSVETLSSVVLPTHALAIRFHERLGFRCTGHSQEALHYEIAVADLARRLRQI